VTDTPRTVVLGTAGQLGTAFRQLLGESAVYLTRAEADLIHPGTLAPVLDSLRPELVLNCAAYTAVDRAESEPDVAATVNADSVEALAAWTAANGAKLVTFSTDYVFDGVKPDAYVESDPAAPINVYGATKRDGEIRALAADPGALVVRTSWVLSGTHSNFAATMLRLGRERSLRVVDDQRGHPTLVEDLAPAVLEAVRLNVSGILHLTNQGVVSWFELARIVFDAAGLDASRLTPCTTEEYPVPAARPRNSVLDSERLTALGLAPLPHFEPALQRAIASLESVR
jgi:dTDP-4-dehydrorhamnose reductase